MRCIFTGVETEHKIKVFGQELACAPEISKLIKDVRTVEGARDKTIAYNQILESETQVLDENSDIVYKINNWLYQEVQKQIQIEKNVKQEESFESLDQYISNDNDDTNDINADKNKKILIALRVMTYATIAVFFIFETIFSSLPADSIYGAQRILMLFTIPKLISLILIVVCLVLVCAKRLQQELKDVFAMDIYFICSSVLSLVLPYIIRAIIY